jgi:L-aspartate oxidase
VAASARAPAGGDRILVIGAGLAGLFTALKLAPLPVTVIAAHRLGLGASSEWAQAGIAAAVGDGDTIEAHAADTIRLGHGIGNERIARMMVEEAPERIEDLLTLGIPFDRDLAGRLALRREAGHSARRIVSVRGDMAGRQIMAALISAVRAVPHVAILEGYDAEELVLSDARAAGVVIRQTTGRSNVRELVTAAAVVLATGGIGRLYAVTTNADDARGEGIAMAARAGALAADLEFVQFHPTAIDVGADPAPLATEALRGEGALLVNRDGTRFMPPLHELAELAPRDIVARAVHRERLSGRGAFLDCRGELGQHMSDSFPTVHAFCRKAGIDPATDLIPVAPAAHYHMGGVFTDAHGRTSLDGLWACGEVASTGVHGANRLASNSLLEAVVFAARVARDIASTHLSQLALRSARASRLPPPASDRLTEAETAEIRRAMSEHVGVERDAAGLLRTLERFDEIGGRLARAGFESNMLVAARLIARAALAREESRGGHYRTDFPDPDPAWQRRSYARFADLARPLPRAAVKGAA